MGGCITHVLSTFRSATWSDTAWGRLLPSDHEEILSRAVVPVGPFASKRELYFRLCEPLLVDGGKMSFSLEKGSGKKCYMLCARELVIGGVEVPRYWRWTSLSDSRFLEGAELRQICWLEIHGKIETKILSPKTSYAAYLVFKIVHGSTGLNTPAQKTSVKVGAHVDEHAVRLQAEEAAAQKSMSMFRHFILRCGALLFPPSQEVENMPEVARLPQARSDGWMEIMLGEFFYEGGDEGEVDMCLMESKGGQWKSGLIIEGIEVKPKVNKRVYLH